MEVLDCAIIGGGPAGLTAGLYTTRGGLENVILFEFGLPGGQITQSSEIENYPGFFDHTKTGMDFMDTWQEQCFSFGLKHEMKKVISVEKKDDLFEIHTESEKTYLAKTVIVATGSTPKRAGFLGEDKYFGKGVSTCATCDGFFYKNKPVAILGGGDTAIEEALYLSNIASEVHIIHRGNKLSAAPSTIERLNNKHNIFVNYNSTINEALGDEKELLDVSILDENNEEHLLGTSGLFVFVGHNVNNQVIHNKNNKPICNLNDNGQIIVNLNMNTSVKGLFAIGDIRIDAPKQVVSAAGDGAIAALQTISYIENME